MTIKFGPVDPARQQQLVDHVVACGLGDGAGISGFAHVHIPAAPTPGQTR